MAVFSPERAHVNIKATHNASKIDGIMYPDAISIKHEQRGHGGVLYGHEQRGQWYGTTPMSPAI
jgi:hypothetical protein